MSSRRSPKNSIPLPLVSDISFALDDLSYVNAITVLALIILAITISLRPNTNAYDQNINTFGQDLVQFFQSNVVVQIVQYAPLLIFVMNRGRLPGYYYILNALVLYAISYLLKISIGTYDEQKYDEFNQSIGFVNANNESANDGSWGKLTAFRWNASRVLRGSAYSCVAVGLLSSILNNSLLG